MANTANFNWATPNDTDLVKDGASAIRTLGSAIDTSLVDLKGGTTGQILSKTSNTDMDFTWITNDVGDITEVTAGTGISGGGTSGAVTITNSMATAIDAKGDLIAGTGADTFDRLAVGTNGQILSADSTASTGLKWITAGSADDFQLINAGGTALTGASTITVSGISNKNMLFIRIEGASSASASSQIRLRLNTDTNTKYGSIFLTQSGTSLDTAANGFDTLDHIVLARMGNAAGDVMNVFATIQGANSTGVKLVNYVGNGSGSTTNNSPVGFGTYSGSSAITSVSVLTTAGNFDAGTIYVYGA